jgi:hypothetical protein
MKVNMFTVNGIGVNTRIDGAFLGLDLEGRLPSIRIPTIHIGGAEDKMGDFLERK